MNGSKMNSEIAIKEIVDIENKIHNIWSDVNTYHLNQLEDVGGSVCREYIESFNSLDGIINSVISNLEELKTCWIHYKNKEFHQDINSVGGFRDE